MKVYNDEDPTSKTLAIDQTWTAWEVCKKMMRKDDKEPDPYWVLVERLSDLGVGKIYVSLSFLLNWANLFKF